MANPMHWARWGDPAAAGPLPGPARAMVEAAFGPVADRATAALADVRLPEPALHDDLLRQLRALLGDEHVQHDHDTRVRHTRGRSTSDLLRLRAGDAADAPDVVVTPADHDEVAAVVAWCSGQRVAVVPFGGGTSVVGGLVPTREGYAGVLALDLRRLDRLLAVDRVSGTAVLQAGLRGPEAETALVQHGLTLGHFPQSFEYASIGGFAATRSSGQASSGYGRFDELVVGLRVATPVGTLDLGRAPATAAGPDLRQLVLGSEGAFGVVTEVTVRVRPQPAVRVYEAWRVDSFPDGLAAVRELAQSGAVPTVLRLADEAETAVNLTALADIGPRDRAAEPPASGCLVVTGYEGDTDQVNRLRAVVTERLQRHATSVGEEPGAAWAHGRFRGPYLRDSLLDAGLLVETVETAAFWSRLDQVYADVRAALETDLTARGTPPIVLCHVSHVYPTGASLYFTVAARQTDDPLDQWASAKAAATNAMVAAGATITHHHAVGREHLPWLTEEVGPVGVDILRAVKRQVDPAGVMNPGVLVP